MEGDYVLLRWGRLAVPQFGGPDPGAGLSTNFAFAGKDGQINFSAHLLSGYRQSLVTQEPSVTIMNGQTGFVSDTSQTPFVISVIPVVGAFPVAPQAPQPPLPMIAPDDLGVDPRIAAVAQERADAKDQAAAQAAAAAQAGGPVRPLPNNQRPNSLAPRRTTAPAAEAAARDPRAGARRSGR